MAQRLQSWRLHGAFLSMGLLQIADPALVELNRPVLYTRKAASSEYKYNGGLSTIEVQI